MKQNLFALILYLTFFAAAPASRSAPLTNGVLATKLLTFSLRTQKDFHPQLQFSSKEMLYYRVLNNSFTFPNATNATSVKYLAFPQYQAFEFNLFNDKGQKITKTASGRNNSQATAVPRSLKDYEELKQKTVIGSESYRLFCPDEFFEIRTEGVYELEVKIKICVPFTNGVPDVCAMTNSHTLYESNTNLTVLTSDPVRVKIIKEANSDP